MVVLPAGQTKERWRRLTLALDQLRQPVAVIGNWRTGPGTVLHINPAWTGLTGYSAAEALGHPATDFLFAPEEDGEAYRKIRDAVAKGSPHLAELLRARKGARPARVKLRAWSLKLTRDGQDYLMSVEIPDGEKPVAPPASRATPAGNVLSFGRPNDGGGRAESQRLAEELISSQQRFQHSLESCAFGVERIDLTGRLLYANPIYHELLGYGDHELIGENVFERLQDPVHARALENYIRHIVAVEPPPTPIFTTYRRQDGSAIRLRLDWSYDRSVSGITIGLLSIVTPLSGWPHGDEAPAPRRAAAPEPADGDTPGGTPKQTAIRDEYSRARLLQQTLHAARVWASILSHRHPEGDDAKIVAKVDGAIDEALRMLGSERRAPIAAASYFEETTPLKGLVVGVVEPVTVLRASTVDLLRSWGCHPVGIERPEDTVAALAKSGRLPDTMLVDLAAAIGVGQDSVIRAVWQRYGAGIPCTLIADRVAPEIEKFAESVGMKIIHRPVHPIELRSAMLALWRNGRRIRRR
jgi:PAS domain S-box-containing protein